MFYKIWIKRQHKQYALQYFKEAAHMFTLLSDTVEEESKTEMREGEKITYVCELIFHCRDNAWNPDWTDFKQRTQFVDWRQLELTKTAVVFLKNSFTYNMLE